MRSRLLSAVIFVAVLRFFPSHREIVSFLRHLLGLFVLALLLVSCDRQTEPSDKGRRASSPVENASYLVQAPVPHHKKPELTTAQRRRLAVEVQALRDMPVLELPSSAR